MTSRLNYTRTTRLDADGTERHSLTSIDDSGARMMANVQGNGTQEKFAVEVPIGSFFNPPSADIEALAGGHGADPHNKIARITQPEATRFKPTKAGRSGSQKVDDPTQRVQFTELGIRTNTPKSQGWAVSEEQGVRGIIEVRNGVLYVRASQIVFQVAPTIGAPPAFQDDE